MVVLSKAIHLVWFHVWSKLVHLTWFLSLLLVPPFMCVFSNFYAFFRKEQTIKFQIVIAANLVASRRKTNTNLQLWDDVMCCSFLCEFSVKLYPAILLCHQPIVCLNHLIGTNMFFEWFFREIKQPISNEIWTITYDHTLIAYRDYITFHP